MAREIIPVPTNLPFLHCVPQVSGLLLYYESPDNSGTQYILEWFHFDGHSLKSISNSKKILAHAIKSNLTCIFFKIMLD